MSLGLMIYLIGTIDVISNAIGFIATMSMIGATVGWAVLYISGTSTEGEKRGYCFCKKLFKIMIIPFILFLFTPSSKTISAMYLLPRLVKNEKVQKIPSKALDILNLKLDEWIEEMKPEKESE